MVFDARGDVFAATEGRLGSDSTGSSEVVSEGVTLLKLDGMTGETRWARQREDNRVLELFTAENGLERWAVRR